MVATFRIDPNRSKVWIEARSSMHPIQGEADGLEGSIEAELADGRIDVSGVPRIQIKLPVDKLQSGKKLEDADPQLYRVQVYRRLLHFLTENPLATDNDLFGTEGSGAKSRAQGLFESIELQSTALPRLPR